MSDIDDMINRLTKRQRHEFALACARRAQRLMRDPRSVDALDVRRQWLRGKSTAKKMGAAWAAAWAAARDAENTEWSDAQHASRAAALAVSGVAVEAAEAVAEAMAWAGSGSVERRAERAWQRKKLEKMLGGGA